MDNNSNNKRVKLHDDNDKSHLTSNQDKRVVCITVKSAVEHDYGFRVIYHYYVPLEEVTADMRILLQSNAKIDTVAAPAFIWESRSKTQRADVEDMSKLFHRIRHYLRRYDPICEGMLEEHEVIVEEYKLSIKVPDPELDLDSEDADMYILNARPKEGYKFNYEYADA